MGWSSVKTQHYVCNKSLFTFSVMFLRNISQEKTDKYSFLMGHKTKGKQKN